MRTFKITLFLTVTTMLCACGTIMSGQTQKITLQTPGTDNAQCTLYNGIRYRATTGDTLVIMRSSHPLEVDCYAPGNRHLTKTIDRDFNDWSIANISNGIVPGVTYDHFSNGLYEYPKIISVDFSGVASPGFGKADMGYNPYGESVEDYTPHDLQIPSDNHFMKRGVQKVDQELVTNPFAGTELEGSAGAAAKAAPAASGSSSSSSKPAATGNTGGGAPQPVLKGSTAEELNRNMNPTVFSK